MGGLHIDDNIVGLSISQWLSCPLAIWNLLFGMAILLHLVKKTYVLSSEPTYAPSGEVNVYLTTLPSNSSIL